MLNSLKKLFSPEEEISDNLGGDLHILCGLMIEAANIDGNIQQQEVDKIFRVLVDVFHENPSEVEVELKKCLTEIGDHKSLHSFTSKINKSFSKEKKIVLFEILWEIILEDKEIHDYETNLIRRLAGLLYISDVQCGNAKNKVLKKLKITN